MADFSGLRFKKRLAKSFKIGSADSDHCMEVILEHLLHRAHELYQEDASSFELHSQLLLPFLDGSFTLEEYLKLDDGVLGPRPHHQV